MNLNDLAYNVIASVTVPTVIGNNLETMRYTMMIGFKPEVFRDEDDVDASVAAIAIVRDYAVSPVPTDLSGDAVSVEFTHEETEYPSVIDALRDNDAIEVLLKEAGYWFDSALMRTVAMASLFQAALKPVIE